MARMTKPQREGRMRLRRLAALLHDHSRGSTVYIPGDGAPRFDMSSWQNHCGTAACAVGCATLSPWFQKQGLKYEGGSPVYRKTDNWAAVQAFFWLDNQEAGYLFSGVSYHSEWYTPTPKQVAKRIREFLANGIPAPYLE